MKYRIVIYIIVMLVLIGLGSIYYYGSSPSFSNRFKGVIEKELSRATGLDVKVSSVGFAPLPFMVELTGVNLKEGQTGKEIGSVHRARVYLKISPLIEKRIEIRVLELSGVTASEHGIAFLAGLVSPSGSQKKGIKIERVMVRAFSINYKKADLSGNFSISKIDYSLRKGQVEFKGKILDMRYRSISLQGMNIDGLLKTDKEGIEIKRVTLNKASTKLTITGNLNPESLSMDTRLRGSLPVEYFLRVINTPIPVKGMVVVDGSLKGQLPDPFFKGRLKLTEGKIYGIEVDSLQTLISASKKELRLSDINAKAYEGEARCEFLMPFPTDGFSLMIAARHLRSDALMDLLGINKLELPDGRVDLMLVHTGRGFHPRGYIKYNASGSVSNPWENVTTAGGFFWFRQGRVFINEVNVLWPHGSLQSGTGWIDTLEKRIYLKGQAFIDSFKRLGVNLDGRFQGGVTLEGPVSGSRIFFGGVLSGLKIKDIAVKDLPVKGCFSGQCLVVNTRAKQDLTVQGVFRKDLVHLLARVTSLPVEDIFEVSEDLKADITGTVSVDGSPSKFNGRAELSISNILYKDLFIGDIDTALLFDKDGFDIPDLIMKKDNSRLMASLKFQEGIIQKGQMSFDLKPEDFGYLRGSGLTLKGKLQGTGPIDRLLLQGKTDIVLDNETLASLDINVLGEKVSLKGRAFNENVEVYGIATLKDEYPWQVDFTLNEADYTALAGSFFSLPEGFHVRTKGFMSLTGNKSGSRLRGTLESIEMKYKEKKMHTEGPLVFEYDGKWLNLGALHLVDTEADVTLMGRINPRDRVADLSVFGNLEMPFFSGIIEGVNFTSGTASFSFSLSGSSLYGGMIFKGIEMVSNIGNIEAVIDGGQIFIENGEFYIKEIHGRMMDGTFSITGEGSLKEGLQISDYNIRGDLNYLIFRPEPDTEFKLKGKLYLIDTVEGPFLTGRLFVVDGMVKRNLTMRDLLSSKDKGQVPKKWSFPRLKMNVSVDVPDTVRIDNNILDATIGGSFTITGGEGFLGAIGSLELKDGHLYFRNNRFELTHASIELTHPEFIRTYIDLTAQTEIREYTIKVNVTGFPDDLKINLYSEPYLDRADILSLLTFGTFAEGTKGIEGEIGASEAALFLTGQLQEGLQERLKTLTGIDRIDIEPYIEETGTIGPRVTFYKRLLSDRLSIVYTTTTTDQTKDTVEMVFKLSDKLSISGQRDENGFLGGDIRLRLRFR